jgi:hypothetical protein
MRIKKRLRIRWFSLFFLLVLPVAAYAGVPEVSHVMLTDVTTRSFSVIWAAGEPSAASLEVYQDENGTLSAVDAVITPHPIESGNESIRTAAENNGVMKVRVTGLAPDTTYYFKTITTSKSTEEIEETTDYPDAAPFISVTTESETVRTYESSGNVLPFSNDLIIEPCYLDDGTTPAEGTLLLATVAGGSHPITAFVGDGVEPPYAIIDLNNVFSRDTFENIDLSQGLNLTLLNFRGLAGNSIVTHVVPEDQSLSEVKPAEFALKVGANMISFQLEPGNTATSAVLNPIISKANAIYAYDAENGWSFYERDGWEFLNTLNDLHAFTGYYLFMEDDASLKVNGMFSSNPIPLKTGVANLVGYRSIETIPIEDAPIFDKLESIWTHDGDWFFYDKYGWDFLNTLAYIEPGKSYYVFVSEDCEW